MKNCQWIYPRPLMKYKFFSDNAILTPSVLYCIVHAFHEVCGLPNFRKQFFAFFRKDHLLCFITINRNLLYYHVVSLQTQQTYGFLLLCKYFILKKKKSPPQNKVFFCLWWKLNLCKKEEKVLHISKIMYVLINFRIREKSRLLFKIKTNYAYSLSVLCI